jgi:nucleoid-associated protein YgaU
MKKLILFIFATLLLSVPLWSQSLEDNEYFQEMLKLRAQSEQAFEDGDYTEAKRLAVEAQGFSERSERWIETQLVAYRARAALNRLKDRLAQVSKWDAQTNFPDEYAEGSALYTRSFGEFYDDEDYSSSLATSNRAFEILSVIQYIAASSNLPAFYVVRLLPGNTDCLWNISGYEFIYDDPWSWRSIYNANKDIMPERDNPDLIHPGMILKIPSLDGEIRFGTWEDGIIK